MDEQKNVFWHRAAVTRHRREANNGHKSAVVWFTGLSGSGKSTLAHAVEEEIHRRGCNSFVLDGDNVRHGLCSDLTFSDEHRVENIRRLGEVAKLFVDAGVITLTAFISPFRADRQRVRDVVGEDDFIEVYCYCPIEICEQRDVKGLYRRARAGEIPHFTGITSPYESPESPDLMLDTGNVPLSVCAEAVIEMLVRKGVVADSEEQEAGLSRFGTLA